MSRPKQAVPRLELLPPERGESSAAYAARVIREAILSAVLEPGSKIPQGAIADRLDMSRIPVREALRQLESEGLVQIPANRPACVARLDVEEFRELYDLRELVEPYAVRKSADLLTAQQLDELVLLAEMFQSRVARGHAGGRTQAGDDVLRIDRDFHLLTMSAAPGQRTKRLVEELQNSTQHFRRAYREQSAPELLRHVCADHFQLIDALRARDGDRAAGIALRHLRRTREVLEPHLTRPE